MIDRNTTTKPYSLGVEWGTGSDWTLVYAKKRWPHVQEKTGERENKSKTLPPPVFSLVLRPHPDFISQPWRKIWVGPGDKASRFYGLNWRLQCGKLDESFGARLTNYEQVEYESLGIEVSWLQTWTLVHNSFPLTDLMWKVMVGPRGRRQTLRLMNSSVRERTRKCVTPSGPATCTKSFRTFFRWTWERVEGELRWWPASSMMSTIAPFPHLQFWCSVWLHDLSQV